jgi:cytochrome P450
MELRVTEMVDGLLDQAAARGVIDIMQDFAMAIPLNLVGDLLGVPGGEREPLRKWAHLILGGLEPVRTPAQLAAGNDAVVEFKQYLLDLIAWKRAHAAQANDIDILWALIRDHDAGDGLTELEIVHNCIFMLNAGHDTTTSLIANGMDLLLRHPEQMARLQAQPALMRTAVEEMLRMESPLQIGNRRTLEPVVLAGREVPAGTFIHVGIAAGNRDERQFDRPDVFDVGREPNRHVAFGHGIHFCAGNALARMEATVAFARLLTRFPRVRRAGPTVRPDRSRFRVVDQLKIDMVP